MQLACCFSGKGNGKGMNLKKKTNGAPRKNWFSKGGDFGGEAIDCFIHQIMGDDK